MNAASAGRPCERRDPYTCRSDSDSRNCPGRYSQLSLSWYDQAFNASVAGLLRCGDVAEHTGLQGTERKGERCLDGLLASLFLPSSLLPMRYLSSHSRNW